jgi:hypothetical protein
MITEKDLTNPGACHHCKIGFKEGEIVYVIYPILAYADKRESIQKSFESIYFHKKCFQVIAGESYLFKGY